MRLVAWNCAMALHRKFDALLALKPDVAVISECARPDILKHKMNDRFPACQPVWIGTRPNKGLGIFAFNGFSMQMHPGYTSRLHYVAPLKVSGPAHFNLLAVWAQNNNENQRRKAIAGPMRDAIRRYRKFIGAAPCIVAGDLNNNVIWDRPGWRMNHASAVADLARLGLASAYHHVRQEAQGRESQPTHYWRDRRKDGPTYHIDFIFAPHRWLAGKCHCTIGSFEDWCGNGLSDHVPVVLDVAVQECDDALAGKRAATTQPRARRAHT